MTYPKFITRTFYKLRPIEEDKNFMGLANELIKNDLSLLTLDRIFFLYQVLKNKIKDKDRNDSFYFLEIGVYLGGTSYFVSKVLKKYSNLNKKNIKIFGVDTFDGHQEIDLKNQDTFHHNKGFKDTSYVAVKKRLSKIDNCILIKGRIQDVADKLPKNIDIIHLDTDLYEPTFFTLEYFGRVLKKTSIILVDDYNFKTCPGVYEAVNQYLLKYDKFYFYSLLSGQCLLIKK